MIAFMPSYFISRGAIQDLLDSSNQFAIFNAIKILIEHCLRFYFPPHLPFVAIDLFSHFLTLSLNVLIVSVLNSRFNGIFTYC